MWLMITLSLRLRTERFSGRIGMSKEERDTWLESILEACRKGGRASAKLLEEAASLVAQLVEDELCNSYEEALELIEFFLSTNHRNRWEASQMGKEATKFVKEQRKQNKCMSDEEAIEAIKGHFGKKGESYAAAWQGIQIGSQIGSQMVKVVTELVNEQVKKGECKTPEETIDWIKSNFGEEGESYAAAWEGANMVTIATEFVTDLKKQRKYTTAKAAMEAIKVAFGDKGESYANEWQDYRLCV